MTNEDKLKSCVFFIEANSFEKYSLWKEHRDVWQEDNLGFCKTVGYIGKRLKNRGVVVEFWFAKIHGQRVCFYSPISRFVDYTMIKNYMVKNYPVHHDGGTRLSYTDARNFHHVINELEK